MSLNSELPLDELEEHAFGFKDLMVDGAHTPSAPELAEILDNINIPSVLNTTEIASLDNGNLSLTFVGIAQSRLFISAVAVEGHARVLFHPNLPDTFFEGATLDDFRLDGYGLSITEELLPDGVVQNTWRLSNPEIVGPQKIAEYSALVRDVMVRYLPSTTDKVSNFEFS